MEDHMKQILLKLQGMPENLMTKEIIIPLLESLGFFKVEFYGGVQEQGKDILCWENSKYDEIKLTVAQVKHFKFTSKASSPQSFQTIYNQILQCFTEELPYCNQSFYSPEEVLLISSHEIDTKLLKTRLTKLKISEKITIIDGIKLVTLLIKNKPELINKILGPEIDIYSKLEPTLNNRTLLKSLGFFASRSIKNFYIDIDFSLGKRTTQLFFHTKFKPSKQKLELDKGAWQILKEQCLFLKDEFELTFLNNSIEEYEISYEQEVAKHINESKENKTVNDIRETEYFSSEPKYQVIIDGILLSKKIEEKRLWIESNTLEYNQRKVETDELKIFIQKCKKIFDCASIILNTKNFYLSSLIQGDPNQVRVNYETTRLKLPIDLIFDTQLNFCLFGEAGAGKTTCLQMYALNKKNDPFRLFIYLPLSRVIKPRVESSCEPVKEMPLEFEEEIVNYLINSDISITYSQFQNLIKTKKICLLLDGIDEVIKDKPKIINEIMTFSDKHKENVQTIITSRSSGSYIDEIPFFDITLLPFTNKQRNIFIDSWFESSNNNIAIDLKEHLKNTKELSESANNPLLTTVLCVIAENNLTLPNTEIKLYNDRLDLLTGYYDNVKNISRIKTPPDSLKILSQKLAFYLHFNFKREEDIKEFEKISVQLMSNYLSEESAKKALRELIDPCNILIPMSNNGKYGFGHLRFQEHLSAKEIINNRRILIGPLLDINWWKSVLLFLSNMNEDLTWLIISVGEEKNITKSRRKVLMEMINERPNIERNNLEFLLNHYLDQKYK